MSLAGGNMDYIFPNITIILEPYVASALWLRGWISIQVTGWEFMALDECMTLQCECEQVHMQNVDQLHAHDCHQNVTEPQATDEALQPSFLTCTTGSPQLL